MVAEVKQHRQWLLELTRTPTAAGREDRVIDWVRDWARRRSSFDLRTDRFGNLELRRRPPRKSSASRARTGSARVSRPPIYLIAHMDHPAFVVERVRGPRSLVAEFRGGVRGEFFNGSKVLLFHGDGAPRRGTVRCGARGPGSGHDRKKTVVIEFTGREVEAETGDILTWDTGRQRTTGDRLFAPATDNLAGVAAAICAFYSIHGTGRAPRPDVRVLLTRCEEIGLVGAVAVCSARLLPKGARMIVLENSQSFPESPIGAGPIVRVGDRISTFDPRLTYQIAQIALKLEKEDSAFKWQRKLMPGGVCEATAFSAFGYTTGCLCLALGNYHNMVLATGRIGPETISLSDFHGLVRLLVAVARRLDDRAGAPALKDQLTATYKRRRHVLEAGR